MVPFVGGRSTVWSAWCPKPTLEEMEGWPKETYDAAVKQMDEACKLLNVQSASEIDGHRQEHDLRLCNKIRPVYSTLQVSASFAVPVVTCANDSLAQSCALRKSLSHLRQPCKLLTVDLSASSLNTADRPP